MDLAIAVEAFIVAGRGAIAGRGRVGILAEVSSGTTGSRADVFLRLHHIKRWRRGNRTIVIGHDSGYTVGEMGGDIVEWMLVCL